MPLTSRLAALIALATVLSVGTARAQNAAAGEAVFKHQCSICHTVQPNDNMVGPTLFGIIGREAGAAENFHYSAANKSSGITWDAEQLDPYLANPKAVVPGTKMSFSGLKDPRQRADVIAYLGTLK